MTNEEIKARVQEALPAKRFEHTLGVVEAALTLAKQYGVDEDRIQKAALLHDYAKPLPKDKLIEIIKNEETNEEFSAYGGVLLHAPAGAYLIQQAFGITDEEIINAVYWHTTGRPNMTVFEKVIFLADFIEPGRHFPGVHEVRKVAENNLDDAITACYVSTIKHLVDNGRLVHPMTLAAYNSMIYDQS